MPDDSDIEAICKTINYELGQAMFDTGLQLTVAKNIEKAVGVFVAKVEGKKGLVFTSNRLLGNIHRTTQTSQVIQAPSESQQHNVSFANCLFFLSSSLDSIMSENRDQMTQDVKMVLTESRDNLGNQKKTLKKF